MRTTLTIDDDLLAVAKVLARDRSESVGKALSDLARRGLRATPRVQTESGESDFPVFAVPRDAHPITLDDVRKAEDELS
jgi:hypothetical protein